MIAYLSDGPLRIDATGDFRPLMIGHIASGKPRHILLCDESFMHDSTEPMTKPEAKTINEYIGKRALGWWFMYKKPTREEAVDRLKVRIEKWQS